MYFERIRQLREDADCTQQNIADYLKCNRQVYARYENGHREIPISMLMKLADYYQVSLDYITGRTDKL